LREKKTKLWWYSFASTSIVVIRVYVANVLFGVGAEANYWGEYQICKSVRKETSLECQENATFPKSDAYGSLSRHWKIDCRANMEVLFLSPRNKSHCLQLANAFASSGCKLAGKAPLALL
jgi:hypothetical protein